MKKRFMDFWNQHIKPHGTVAFVWAFILGLLFAPFGEPMGKFLFPTTPLIPIYLDSPDGVPSASVSIVCDGQVECVSNQYGHGHVRQNVHSLQCYYDGQPLLIRSSKWNGFMYKIDVDLRSENTVSLTVKPAFSSTQAKLQK